jgi:hypothetical protein
VAIQFCLTSKGLFNLTGSNWQVPDFGAVSRRQKHLTVKIGRTDDG